MRHGKRDIWRYCRTIFYKFLLIVILRRIALTKLDILDDQPIVKIGVGYLINGQKIDYYPSMSVSRSVSYCCPIVLNLRLLVCVLQKNFC